MNPARTIALVDGLAGGHHASYLRLFADVLASQGWRVLVLLPDPAALADLTGVAPAGGQGAVTPHRYRHPHVTSPAWRLRRIVKPLRLWRQAARAVRAAGREAGARPDVVFFAWLDDYVIGASPIVPRLLRLVFPYRWSGLLFHPWHLRIAGGATRPDSVAAEAMPRTARCFGVAVLDDGIAAALAANIAKPVVVFPDVTDSRLPERPVALVERIARAARGRPVIALVGNLTRRKGVGLFLRAAAAMGDDACFVMAGACGPAERATLEPETRAALDAALAGGDAALVIHPDWLDDEREFNAVVAACDVMFAVYEQFAHSSGIVSKAAAFERSVLVSRGYYMEELVTRYGIGEAVEASDLEAVVAALRRLCGRERWIAERRPRFADFNRDHSRAAFAAALTKLLELAR